MFHRPLYNPYNSDVKKTLAGNKRLGWSMSINTGNH